MEYKQLLLSAGGGIVSNTQKDEQAPCATIAIGLGGTGVACLRSLKRRVYSRLQPDDPKAVVPEYSHIRFLAVDTDKSSLDPDGQNYDLDINTEFFDISSPNITGLLAKDKVLAGQPECKWLKNKDEHGQGGLSIQSATAGAGGVRQVGRLLIIEKSDAFVARVSQMINEAKAGIVSASDSGCDVNIHIFSGLGGGTGSGTFLDVCYLVQKALNDIGEYGHARVCGYFFLPDVNLSNPTVSANPSVSKYIKINGFAAMKELDYCMNYGQNGGEWDQMYRGFPFRSKDTPVNLCHLISASNTAGAVMENGFHYALNVVTDYIMQFVVKSSGFTLASHIGNFAQEMAQVHKDHGANYCYCILGASNAIVPMREITTYLSSKLFEGMSRSFEVIPSDPDIAAFAEANGLTYKELFKELLTGTTYQAPVPELDHKMFTGMSEADLALPDEFQLPETIMNPFRQRQTKMVGKVEENKSALLHPWSPKDPEAQEDSVSKMCRVYTALANVIEDPVKGPVYAAAILKGTGRRNLVDILRGVQKETQDAMRKIKGDMELRIKAIKDARHAFLHPGIFDSKRNLFTAFIQRVSQYFTSDSQILALEQMESMLRDMIDQMNWLYENHFSIYTQVSRNLMETFHRNYQYLTSDKKPNADPFVMPLMTIEDLQDSLDKAVESMNLGSETSYFHKALFANHEVWLHNEEKNIAKFVSDYLLGKFSNYSNKSLTNYLEIKFNTTAPSALANQVYNQIMIPLSNKATPLFWRSPSYAITDAAPLGYCSVPNTAPAIQNAANTLVSNRPELQMISSGIPDRICMLRCSCGVPLYGYVGIETYHHVYKSSTNIGTHLYEKSERDERDWRLLPNMIPYSANNDPDQRLQEASDLYDEAEKLHIIRTSPSNENDYEIVIYPAIDELQQAVDASSGNIQAIQAAAAAVDQFLATRQPVEYFSIPNDGASGHEANVRKDHVLDSRKLVGLLRQEVSKEQALEAMKKTLQDNLTHIQKTGSLRSDFFNAMMTGVFVYKIPKVTYTKIFMGMTNEITLSDPRTEPYGKFVPLYQAFLTYSAMSDADRDEIDNTVNTRMGNVDPALKIACDNLTAIFTDQYMGMQQNMVNLNVNTQDPAKGQEILQFLIAFRQSLENFRMMYGLM